ncbi:hypothetical protein [Pontibaca salina]|uniref:Uncharacterized protein n=1 Tax=Pontibaca salina TaxID=2795731 RepID=A0A934HUS6_9RHOB|nr:hypothetical protein [Pontibaca salina]MBI6630900.1 hypothetical protein [Pontibaca salina]
MAFELFIGQGFWRLHAQVSGAFEQAVQSIPIAFQGCHRSARDQELCQNRPFFGCRNHRAIAHLFHCQKIFRVGLGDFSGFGNLLADLGEAILAVAFSLTARQAGTPGEEIFLSVFGERGHRNVPEELDHQIFKGVDISLHRFGWMVLAGLCECLRDEDWCFHEALEILDAMVGQQVAAGMAHIITVENIDFGVVDATLQRHRLSAQIARDRVRQGQSDHLRGFFQELLDIFPVSASCGAAQGTVLGFEPDDAAINLCIAAGFRCALLIKNAGKFSAKHFAQQRLGICRAEGSLSHCVHDVCLLLLVDREQPCGALHGVEREVGAQGQTEK